MIEKQGGDQAANRQDSKDDEEIQDQSGTHSEGPSLTDSQAFFVMAIKGHRDDDHKVKTCDPDCQQEEEKVAVVPLPNTIRNPRAVVIEFLHTVVTIVAMGSARRPEDLARVAILASYQLAVCIAHLATNHKGRVELMVKEPGDHFAVFIVLIGIIVFQGINWTRVAWQDSRISPGCPIAVVENSHTKGNKRHIPPQ